MRFIAYARASTQDNQTPEHQIAELRAWAATHGHEIVLEVVERASGTKDDRPLWKDVLTRVLRSEADGIAAVELSRFARSAAHLLNVAKSLRTHDRHLVVTRRRIDTTTPEGRLLFTIQAALDEYVADIGRDAIRSGIKFARSRNGGTWGRRRELDDDTRLRARYHRAQGLSWSQVSAELAREGFVQPARSGGRSAHERRPWPVGTLRNALRNTRPKPTPVTPHSVRG